MTYTGAFKYSVRHHGGVGRGARFAYRTAYRLAPLEGKQTVITMHWFLDRPHVRRLVGDWELRLLGKIGGIARSWVRNSMKFVLPKEFLKRKPRKDRLEHSPPGTPPYYHEHGKHVFNLRNRIFYALDPYDKSVVIGPDEKTHKIARLHEFGGTKRVKYRRGNRWIDTIAKYPPRPFLEPLIDARGEILERAYKRIGEIKPKGASLFARTA